MTYETPKLCEQCGQHLNNRPRKIIGKKGWCSNTCLIKAGIYPKPEPRPLASKPYAPRVPVYRGSL